MAILSPLTVLSLWKHQSYSCRNVHKYYKPRRKIKTHWLSDPVFYAYRGPIRACNKKGKPPSWVGYGTPLPASATNIWLDLLPAHTLLITLASQNRCSSNLAVSPSTFSFRALLCRQAKIYLAHKCP